MKISIAQMNTKVGDFDHTVDRMVAQATAAHGQGSELVIFPLPVLTGPGPGGLSESEEFFFDLSEALEQLAKRVPCACVVPIVVDMGEGVAFEAVLVKDGEATPLRLASYLTALASQGEESADLPMNDLVEFDIDGVGFGIAFDSAGLERFAAGDGDVDVICYLPSYCYDTDDEATALAPSLSEGCFIQDASDANAWIVAASAVGGYDDQVFTGGSFVLAPWGELACAAPSFEEMLLTCDVDLLSEGPLAHSASIPPYHRARHLWNALVISTRDFVNKQGMADVVIALDGSLASSALAALSVDALGPMHVHALIDGTDSAAASDARRVARDLRLDSEDVSECLAAEPFEADQAARRDLLVTLLAAKARRVGGCVLSSRDKTWAATVPEVNGCSCASFAPFGDVYRTDVATLARERNTVSPVIPPETFSRLDLPSGLGLELLSQTAEGQLNELDAMLLLHVERGMGLSSIIEERAKPEVAAAILERVQACELARRSFPMHPVVSDCTFSERAWPLGLAWHDRVREGWGEMGVDGLRQGVESFIRALVDGHHDEGEQGSAHDVSSVMGFLRDFAQGGGLHQEDDDLWGQGLFSNN